VHYTPAIYIFLCWTWTWTLVTVKLSLASCVRRKKLPPALVKEVVVVNVWHDWRQRVQVNEAVVHNGQYLFLLFPLPPSWTKAKVWDVTWNLFSSVIIIHPHFAFVHDGGRGNKRNRYWTIMYNSFVTFDLCLQSCHTFTTHLFTQSRKEASFSLRTRQGNSLTYECPFSSAQKYIIAGCILHSLLHPACVEWWWGVWPNINKRMASFATLLHSRGCGSAKEFKRKDYPRILNERASSFSVCSGQILSNQGVNSSDEFRLIACMCGYILPPTLAICSTRRRENRPQKYPQSDLVIVLCW